MAFWMVVGSTACVLLGALLLHCACHTHGNNTDEAPSATATAAQPTAAHRSSDKAKQADSPAEAREGLQHARDAPEDLQEFRAADVHMGSSHRGNGELSQTHQQHDGLARELKQLHAELERAREASAKDTSTLRAHEEEIGALKAAAKQADQAQTTLRDECDALQRKLQETSDQLEVLLMQHKETPNQLEDLKAAAEQAEQAQKALRDECDVLQRKLQETSDQLEVLRSQHNETPNQLEALRSQHAETSIQLKALRSQHEETPSQLEALRLQHAETSNQLQALRSQHEETFNQLESLRSVHDERTCKAIASEASAAEERRQLQEQIRELREASASEERHQLQEQIRELREARAAEERHQLHEQIRDLRELVDILKSDKVAVRSKDAALQLDALTVTTAVASQLAGPVAAKGNDAGAHRLENDLQDIPLMALAAGPIIWGLLVFEKCCLGAKVADIPIFQCKNGEPHQVMEVSLCERCGKICPSVMVALAHEEQCWQQPFTIDIESPVKVPSMALAERFKHHIKLAQDCRVDCFHHRHFKGGCGRHLGICTHWNDDDEFGVVLMNSEHGGEEELFVPKTEIQNTAKLSPPDILSFEIKIDKRKDKSCDMDELSAVHVAVNVLRHSIVTPKNIGSVEGVQSDCWKEVLNQKENCDDHKSITEIIYHRQTANISFHRYCIFLRNSSGENFHIAPVILPDNSLALHATKVVLSTPQAQTLHQPERCKWMFADAASGAVGFAEAAHLNPWRWSQTSTMQKAASDLEVYRTGKHASRPVRFQLFPGAGWYKECKTVEEAILFTRTLI